MFCTNCGKKLPDHVKFCTACGHPVKPRAEGPAPAQQPVHEAPAAPTVPPQPAYEAHSTGSAPRRSVPPVAPPMPQQATQGAQTPPPVPPQPPRPQGPSGEPPEEPGKKKKTGLIVGAAILGVALLAVGGFFLFQTFLGGGTPQADASGAPQPSGQGGISHALEAKPQDPEAVLGLAESYLHTGAFADAAEALEGLELSEKDEGYERYKALLSLSALEPELQSVSLESFPQVTVTLSCGGDYPLSAENVALMENGGEQVLTGVEQRDGALILQYTAPTAGVAAEERTLGISLMAEGFTFPVSGSYAPPALAEARVELVTTDVSDYPTVKLYFRVEDEATGEAVEGLEAGAFTLLERLQGGEYLSREVHNAVTLESRGLNIGLVADKSSSIESYDMDKIKTVMTEFVESLRYDVGDRAEILAFDDIVQQMCYYTDDAALLANGIAYMSTDGRTAFYNALHDGIRNAALQGGARCVIAFTDGIDNESFYTPQEIVNYSLTSQVPVYVIGVGGSVEEYVLRTIAESTGGRYWFIDDLYDLQEIFDEIYAEQKELYVVEYESDPAAGQYAPRDLSVTVSGGGYLAQQETSFEPVRSLGDVTHTSRYELVKEALTWEEASQRCQEMGGHLVTITSQDEMDQITALCEGEDIRYVWLGGYTSYDRDGNVFGHWVTGETFDFQPWFTGEPSRVDQDGTAEWYIMLWNLLDNGGWSWNDQRNDPVSAVPNMAPRMGFICEYEN